jgi:DNA-binding CsgD family transcriptional regulator
MTEERSAAVPHIIDELYAGTLDDSAWNRALVSLADLIGASGAGLFAFNPSTGAVLRDENYRIDPSTLSDYARYWTFQDCRREPFLKVPAGVAGTEALLELPDLKKTLFFNDFLVKNDLPHFMPAWLYKTPEKAVVLSLQGTRKRGAFDRSDVRAFQQLIPHVTRALQIRDRLEAAQIRGNAFLRSLEGFHCGVMVLDGTGRVLEANAIADAHLRSGDGVRRKVSGSLALREPADTQLRAWLASGVPPAGSEGLLCVPRRCALPLTLLLAPVPDSTVTWLTHDPRWLVLVLDASRRVSASAVILEKALGVSAREAEVAAHLFEGHTPQAVAQQLGVSAETVRSQLKSIFRKTGTRSQAELLKRIALGAAVRGANPAPVGPCGSTR